MTNESSTCLALQKLTETADAAAAAAANVPIHAEVFASLAAAARELRALIAGEVHTPLPPATGTPAQ